eukprot:7849844-Alexandrium_andersonii.AAC.1
MGRRRGSTRRARSATASASPRRGPAQLAVCKGAATAAPPSAPWRGSPTPPWSPARPACAAARCAR